MSNMSLLPSMPMPSNPAEHPGVAFDHLVHVLVGELGLSIHGVTDVAGVRFQVVEKLKWWQVLRHAFTAQYFPLTPEAAECAPTRGYSYNRFRVAHAIATRACRRYGPRHGIINGLIFVGSYAYRANPADYDVMADMWLDLRQTLVVMVMDGNRIELPFSSLVSPVVSTALERYLYQDVSHQPIVLDCPWQPLRRTSAEWCVKLHTDSDAISAAGWHADSPLGILSWNAAITRVEFELRCLISRQLAGDILG